MAGSSAGAMNFYVSTFDVDEEARPSFFARIPSTNLLKKHAWGLENDTLYLKTAQKIGAVRKALSNEIVPLGARNIHTEPSTAEISEPFLKHLPGLWLLVTPLPLPLPLPLPF